VKKKRTEEEGVGRRRIGRGGGIRSGGVPTCGSIPRTKIKDEEEVKVGMKEEDEELADEVVEKED